MSKTIKLYFDGCYEVRDLPVKKHQCSGIYTVNTGKLEDPDKCSLRKILYIGEAENVETRLRKTHETFNEWCTYLGQGENLFFTIADVSDSDREQAEAALIFHHQPPCNKQNKDSFDYPETRIIITDDNGLLDKDFIVSKN
jgi:excinuclease UvrABC nuclease subunit